MLNKLEKLERGNLGQQGLIQLLKFWKYRHRGAAGENRVLIILVMIFL